MVPAEQIDALYESTLAPRLKALEALRLDVRAYVVKAGLLVGVPAVLLWANDLVALALPDGLGWLAIVGPIVGLVAGLIVAATKYLLPGFSAFANYRSRFKHEVAAEVFKIVCPTATYSPFDGIAQEVVAEPGLFNARGNHSSDDRVRGKIGQTPFEAADVNLSYSTGGKNNTTIVVFRGLFFHLDFNKRLSGTTLIDPRSAKSVTIGDRSALVEVALENPAFGEQFRVWASDEVEARYILTPSMMERLLVLATLSEKPVHLAFKNHRAFLGVNYGRALFEPGIRDSTSAAAIHEMAAQFGLAEGIVEELDLNTRIWTKGVDDSLLHAPDAPLPTDRMAQAAREGTLSPEKIWTAALQSVSETHNADDANATQPASTSIAIDRSPQGVTVRYGRTLSLVVTIGLWVVAVAVALAAARLLPEALRKPDLAPIVQWVPVVPYASSFVRSEPLVWFLVSSALAGVFLLMWAFVVRRVEIAPDAVRIWRGLRPFPRVYPRPPYGMISRVKQYLYVGKTDSFSLFNASASPALSDEEAAWVAAELRRAMRETAR
jgi:Protein of unknown function (DUF3137)